MKKYKNPYFEHIVRKQFGEFLFEEMAMVRGLIQFLLKGKHNFDISAENYWEQKGWKDFKEFLKECRKYYRGITFSEILKGEIPLYKKDWGSLLPEDQNKIKRFVKRLDKDGI
jgi:hypothetical protein